MIAFIDDHREVYGVEPICGLLRIASSTCHAHVARRADPAQASPRARQDLALMERIRRVHAANFGVYGARKVWRQLGREGTAVARCTVERLMRRTGLRLRQTRGGSTAQVQAMELLVNAPHTKLPIQSSRVAIMNRQTEIARKLAAELALPPAQRSRSGMGARDPARPIDKWDF